MPSTLGFSYDAAFERNLGWFTEADQLALRGKRVAIAGMGGVGGVHLITLTRLGIGAFHIADFDRFSLANFNRQYGAAVETIDHAKADVMEAKALAINPQLKISRFDQGVNEGNLDVFLSGVDLYVDGLDFFVLDVRRKVFARCHALGIPTVTAGPIGMGTSLLAFVPNGMSFEQYFRMEGRTAQQQQLRFLFGLVPKPVHQRYLVDRTRLNLEKKIAPSTGAACELCAGVAAITAVKLLLRRGDVRPAPWSHHYDAFLGTLTSTKLRSGLDGPLQRLKLRLLGPKVIAAMLRQAPPPETFIPEDTIDEILHAARWAPSGDNTQPWQFEKLDRHTIVVHLARRDPRNVYHYRDDEPNVLACGMLLTNLRIAASMQGWRLDWRVDGGPDPLRLRVQFVPDPSISADGLFAALGQRSVDRNRYRTRKLTGAERAALAASLGGQLQIDWHEAPAARWRFARLSARATDIRLRTPEALRTHQEIIDWDVNLSPAKIPAGALGLSAATRRVMRWGLQSRERTAVLNRLGGTVSAALEMDYVPILSSAAAFTLRFPAGSQRGTEELLQAGECIQRFWLTAARHGLALQPAMAVLIFADYGQKATPFTTDAAVLAKAAQLAEKFRGVLGDGTQDFVFMGRIGEPLPRLGVCRSVRKPVAALMVPAAVTPSLAEVE
jgi:molybdopterin/thiamine biosynthesis adenylyltransferase/nitroreductase